MLKCCMSLKSFLPEYGLDLKTDPKFGLEKNSMETNS